MGKNILDERAAADTEETQLSWRNFLFWAKKNGKKLAQAYILSQEKYGYDGCVIDFDDATIAEAVGA